MAPYVERYRTLSFGLHPSDSTNCFGDNEMGSRGTGAPSHLERPRLLRPLIRSARRPSTNRHNALYRPLDSARLCAAALCVSRATSCDVGRMGVVACGSIAWRFGREAHRSVVADRAARSCLM